jgi:uncharacterized membrane protein YphA (DoxX/SURF4 family)
VDRFIHIFKNVAIAGGLLHVIAFGGGRLSLDGRRAWHVGSSAHRSEDDHPRQG